MRPGLIGGAETSARRLIVRGVKWNTLYQVFETALALGTMLVLVRVIPPVEYGRVGVMLGLLGLLNSLNFGVFAAQALQLPDGREPDWSLHWTAGLYIQAALIVACNALAGLCWLAPEYQPVAPLLHLAALGLVLDWPAQLRMVMLRRALDFRRLRILLALSSVASLAVTFAAGLGGGGAYALVLGANVVMPVPFAIDLLVIHRWRPGSGWWRWPNLRAYRPALTFGLQQAASGLLSKSRGALEGLVLPRATGYVAIGLLNRARALFAITAGRPGSILGDTVYPLLPRYAADPAQYTRRSTLFAQVLLLVLVPSALYVVLEGRELSRLLYGERWVAADPLIPPAALAGLGIGVSGIGSTLLLASNRLRLCTILEAFGAVLALPALAVAWAGHGIVAFAWVAAGGQLLGATAALAATSTLLRPGWARPALVPPVLSSVLAAGAVLAARSVWPQHSWVAVGLLLDTATYALALVLSLRALFPHALTTVLSQTPGGSWLSGWLRLSRAPAASASRSPR